MSRAHRIEIPNTIYHIISRGNNKNNIFQDEKDYSIFLKHLKETKEEKDFLIYAYCLMPNHFHLLIETLEAPLSKVMQKLLTSYAIYFNSKYERTGHVFQGRYKSRICADEKYLLKLLLYVHLNPLKAGLASLIDKYKWCSHLCYTGKNTNKILSIEKLFHYIDFGTLEEGQRAYAVLSKEESKRYVNSEGFNGNEEFNFKICSLEEILENIALKLNISKEIIISKNKEIKVNFARKLFSYEAVKKHGYSLKETANFINRDISIVSKNLKEHQDCNFRVRP